MRKRNEYSQHGEWSGFSVHCAKTGWVVEKWSQVQGTVTGKRYIVAYNQYPELSPDAPLDAEWNIEMTNARAIADLFAPARILRKGYVVQ